MSEFSVLFKNKLNGYDKAEVDQFVKTAEAKLQEKAYAMANLQQRVADLEARLARLTQNDTSVEEKVEMYDKLMKKMDGDYTNLLAPAIAKAQALEKKAEEEYAVRIDQARYAAEGIYKETADRIAGVVDQNMDRMYELLDRYMYSKTLPGKVEGMIKDCRLVAARIAVGIDQLTRASGKAYKKAKKSCVDAREKMNRTVESYREAIVAAKNAD